MAPATVSPKSDPLDPALRWSDQVSLTPRILAVNVFALLLLGGGFFYLDSFRTRILDSRVMQVRREAGLMAEALAAAPNAARPALLTRLARDTGARLQLLDSQDQVLLDSEQLGGPAFTLIDPRTDGLSQRAARWLDAGIDFIVRAPSSPNYDPARNRIPPDPDMARQTLALSATVWRAPDRTPVITAAAALPDRSTILSTINARDITERVRVERYRLSLVVLTALAISVALSLFLARTIVGPLRRLARAAVRVRLGRAREVVVPRLPDRRDEIGMLARALSDMSLALRARIDVDRVLHGEAIGRPGAIETRIGIAHQHAADLGRQIGKLPLQQRPHAARHLGLVGRLELEGCGAGAHGMGVDAGDGGNVGRSGRADRDVSHRRIVAKAQKKAPRPCGPGRALCCVLALSGGRP